jgi:ectoine hydroxylase
VHGSAPNISPFNRTIVIITFNSVANALPPMPNPRPEFLASRTSKEIVPVADDVFTGRTEKLQENAEVMTS